MECTLAFSNSKLEILCKEAFMAYLRRLKDTDNSEEGITENDFDDALLLVQPAHSVSSNDRKIITWEDIGGLQDTKQLLQSVIEWPLRYPQQFSRMNLKTSSGILLYGPPGCCKVC